jgi:predicted enzyme related to lactoylglutathione lyase
MAGMPQFEQHAPGTFAWPELATSDQKAAVAFYRAVFGWGVNEQPIGPNDVYSLFQLNGREVAAGYTMRDDEKKMGIPPHWNNYITVANVDDATMLAERLGGTIIAKPFDVMDAGRMSVVKDPTGAVFCLWQSGRSIGARTLGEPGSLCWTELTTTDTAKAEAFYTSLFGWTPKHSSLDAPMQYTEFTVAGAPGPSIGMLAKQPHMPAEMTSNWLPYFQVTSVDDSIGKVTANGGQVHFGPMEIPGTGRFAVIADPQGAAFALYEPKR